MGWWKKRSKRFRKVAIAAGVAVGVGGPAGVAVVAPDLVAEVMRIVLGGGQ